MADYETVEEYTIAERGRVESVTIRRTDDPQYPSGWDYALHYGTIGGETLLRYDNAHERTKGHERHTPDGTERIEFPGMLALVERFDSEIDALRPD
jgi:hypothetical protein